jgi:5-methylthioribose kinase
MIDIADEAALIPYLRERGLIASGERLETAVLAGGVSCNTVMVRTRTNGDFVVKQALPRLRVAVEWLSDPSRIHREALGMRYLRQLCPNGAITDLLFEDDDQHLIIMSAVASPHSNWKDLLLAAQLERTHITKFANLLATIHRESHLRQQEIQPLFEDRSFFESLRLEPYYRYTSEKVPEARQFLSELIEETLCSRLSLVHGDYSPKNILVRGDDLVLLDHEVIHFGDPSFDLGFALAHLLSKAHHLLAHRKRFVEAALQFVATYECGIMSLEQGDAFQRRAAKHTLACLLARVVGRSTLEYLGPAERECQRRIVTELMVTPAKNLSAQIRDFYERLACQS